MSELICIAFGIFIGYYMGNTKFRQWLNNKAKAKQKQEPKP